MRRARAFVLGALVLVACESGVQRAAPGEACGEPRQCVAPALCLAGRCVLPATDAGVDAGDRPPVAQSDGGVPPLSQPDAAMNVKVDSGPDPFELQRAASGCGDGMREGLLDVARFPNIAACSGGWTFPGLFGEGTHEPVCDRRTGDDAANWGFNCRAADLCAPGWRICEHLSEVKAHGPADCSPITEATPYPVFFATRQRGADEVQGGGTVCDPMSPGVNNVMGCGTLGAPATTASCGPFRMLVVRPGQADDCDLFTPWSCGSDNKSELVNVAKFGASRGGVLCCRNELLP